MEAIKECELPEENVCGYKRIRLRVDGALFTSVLVSSWTKKESFLVSCYKDSKRTPNHDYQMQASWGITLKEIQLIS